MKYLHRNPKSPSSWQASTVTDLANTTFEIDFFNLYAFLFLSMQTLEQKHITAHRKTSFKFSLHFNSSKFHRPFTTCGPLILLRLQSLPSFFSFLFRKLCFTRFVLSPVLRIPLVLTPVIIRGLFTLCFCSRGTARQWRLFKWSPAPYIPRVLFCLFWLFTLLRFQISRTSGSGFALYLWMNEDFSDTNQLNRMYGTGNRSRFFNTSKSKDKLTRPQASLKPPTWNNIADYEFDTTGSL